MPKLCGCDRWMKGVVLSGVLASRAIAGEPPQTLENLLRALSDSRAQTSLNSDAGPLQKHLNELLVERNRVFEQNGGFFQLLLQSRSKYETLTRAAIELGNANRVFSAAQANLVQQQALAVQAGKEPLGYANAQAFYRRADADKRAKEVTYQNALRDRNDHVKTFTHQGRALFGVYISMRRLLPRRRDPANEVIIEVISGGREHAPEFIEGNLIEAIALVYAGRDEEATERLQEAVKILDRCPPLYETMFAEDCCATWLLLGRLDLAGRFINELEKRPVGSRTSAQQWLLAAHSAMRGRHAEADRSYNLASKKAGANPPATLKAEAALAALAALRPSRAIKKAKNYLAGLEAESQWTVLRARAALAAAEQEWDKAVTLLEEAKRQAPACMERELEEQQVAHQQEEPWPASSVR